MKREQTGEANERKGKVKRGKRWSKWTRGGGCPGPTRVKMKREVVRYDWSDWINTRQTVG